VLRVALYEDATHQTGAVPIGSAQGDVFCACFRAVG
jgi:hypothetical protein